MKNDLRVMKQILFDTGPLTLVRWQDLLSLIPATDHDQRQFPVFLVHICFSKKSPPPLVEFANMCLTLPYLTLQYLFSIFVS